MIRFIKREISDTRSLSPTTKRTAKHALQACAGSDMRRLVAHVAYAERPADGCSRCILSNLGPECSIDRSIDVLFDSLTLPPPSHSPSPLSVLLRLIRILSRATKRTRTTRPTSCGRVSCCLKTRCTTRVCYLVYMRCQLLNCRRLHKCPHCHE